MDIVPALEVSAQVDCGQSIRVVPLIVHLLLKKGLKLSIEPFELLSQHFPILRPKPMLESNLCVDCGLGGRLADGGLRVIAIDAAY